MKYYCKYHKEVELIKSKENKFESVYVCMVCKKNKEHGKDGIYLEEDLIKEQLSLKGSIEKSREKSCGTHAQGIVLGPIDIYCKGKALDNDNEKKNDQKSVKNIYDDPAYDYYDGF